MDSTTTQEKQVTIIVNGRPRPVDKGKLTFEDIVRLAFPNATFGPDVEYTVTFSKGPDAKKEGTLTAGQSIEVKEGMIFNVTETNKS
jgi:hypothetical protein